MRIERREPAKGQPTPVGFGSFLRKSRSLDLAAGRAVRFVHGLAKYLVNNDANCHEQSHANGVLGQLGTGLVLQKLLQHVVFSLGLKKIRSISRAASGRWDSPEVTRSTGVIPGVLS